jgi:sugar-specific transcriptional regulator TrmB
MDRQLENNLLSLGFSHMEARVFIALVKGGAANGYKLAKNLAVARPSVYSALDSLYQKGCVFHLPGESNVFAAKNPVEILDSIAGNFTANLESARDAFSKLENWEEESGYLNISGYEALADTGIAIIKSAEQEILINTDFPMELLSKELAAAAKRGVKVYFFSFKKPEKEIEGVEVYYYPPDTKNLEAQKSMKLEGGNFRLMLVSDMQTALMGGREMGPYLGTWSRNRLFASILAEHIHHDIYLFKLYRKNNVQPVQDEIRIGSLLEKRSLEERGGR